MANEYTVTIKTRLDSSELPGDARKVESEVDRMAQRTAQQAQLAQKAFAGVNQEVANLVQRVPVIGPRLAGITDQLQRAGRDGGASVEKLRGNLKTLEDQAQRVKNRFNDFNETLRITFGGKVDTKFLQQFRSAENETKKLSLLTKAVGEDAAGMFSKVERSAFQFAKLERDGGRALEIIQGKTAKATSELSQLTAGTASAGGGMAAIAGPAAIAVAAIMAIVIAYGAAVAAGVKFVQTLYDLSVAAAEYDGQLKDLNQQTGISVETLSTLKLAADNSGSSIEGVNTSLAKYLANISAANHGNDEMVKKLKQVGFTQDELNRAYQSSDEAIRLLIEKVGDLSSEEDRLNALRLVGIKNGKDMNAVITEMDGSLDDFRQTAEELGLVITREQAEAADKFSDSLHILELQIKGLGFTIGREVMPEFQEAIGDLSKGIKDSREDFRLLGSIASIALKKILDDARGLIEALKIMGSLPAFRLLIPQKGTTIGGMSMGGFEDTASVFMPRGRLGDSEGKASDKARQEQLRQLEEQLKDVERVYKNQTEALKREYDLQLISLQDFTDRSVRLELERVTKKQEILLKEFALAKTASERDKYSREFQEAQDEYDRNEQKFTDEQNQKEIEDLRAQREHLLKLGAEYDARTIANVRALIEARAITEEKGETRIAEIQREAYTRRWDALIADREAIIERAGGIEANANQEALNEVNRHIKELEEAEKTAAVERERRIFNARQRDLDNLRQYHQQVRDLESQNQSLRIGIGRGRSQRLEALGAPSDYTRWAQDYYDTLEEITRHREAKLALIVQQSQINLSKLDAEKRAEVLQLFRERQELLEVQHQDRLAEIRERPLVEYIERVRHYADIIGDVIGSAFGSIFEKGQSFWENMVDGFRRMFSQIVAEWVRSGVSRMLQSLFNPSATPSSSGSGGGSIFGTILRAVTGGFSRSGASASAVSSPAWGAFGQSLGWPNISNLFESSHHGGLTTPTSITGQQQSAWQAVTQTGTNAASGLFGGLTMKGLGASLGSMLPFLGAGLGASLGGGGGLGGIVGGAGGLLAGGIGAAFLAPGLFGVVPGAMTVAGSGSAAFMAGLHAFLTNPFTIGIAGAALVAAYFINRSAKRRKNEKDRAQLNSDTYQSIISILNAARSGKYASIDDARADFNKVKTDYFARIANYDGKTKDIAARVWNNEFQPVYWPLIEQAVKESEERNKIRNRMNPEFHSGGYNLQDQLIKVMPGEGLRFPGTNTVHVIPGQYRGYDSEFMYAPAGTQIISRNEMHAAPGYQTGGTTGERPLNIYIEINEDGDDVSALVRSPEFADAVVHVTRKKRKAVHKK